MRILQSLYQYLRYWFKSNTLHGTHSPFVYRLLEEQVYNKDVFPEYQKVENLRQRLKNDSRQVFISDLGAGSRVNANKKRAISDIARNSLKKKKYSQLIFRLIKHFKSEIMIELGTSLGITSTYIALANPNGYLYTLEGSEACLLIADEQFRATELKNVENIPGNFDSTFPELLSRLPKVDFVFFDGNHQKEATLNYFYQALGKAHEDSLFIFDDIYWSKGMSEAWEEIKGNERVRVTIDLFFIALVFFRKEQVKENFVIRF